MTAADRPSVTDDARAVREAAMSLYRAMRRTNPDAWAEVDEVEDWTYWDDIVRTARVTLAAGRAETTTATTEDAVERVFQTTHPAPNTVMGWIRAGYEAGLLATARTRPTRTAIARAICESTNPGIPAAWNAYRDQWLQDADAVLALWADQPTEAEAGARALVHAAGDHFHAMVAAGAGNPGEVSTWLRERAARLRGGDDQ